MSEVELSGNIDLTEKPRSDGYRPISKMLLAVGYFLPRDLLEGRNRLIFTAARKLDSAHKHIETARELIGSEREFLNR